MSIAVKRSRIAQCTQCS